jgi:hypothetical protein
MPPVGHIWRYAAVLLVLAGCRPVNTLPEPVNPTDPGLEHTLEIPANLEVRHVDFSATTFGGKTTGISVEGRGFLEVYAVDRTTGDSVLLLYEDITVRAQPIQIIRFRSAPR